MRISTLVEFRVKALTLHSLRLMSFSRTRQYKMPLLIPQGMVVEARQKSLFFLYYHSKGLKWESAHREGKCHIAFCSSGADASDSP